MNPPTEMGSLFGQEPEKSEEERTWLLVTYYPVSLFSLRTTYATSKGGKTLLVPTPYAVKMALLDACFRCFDPPSAATQAVRVFDLIKQRDFRFRPPKHCLVQHTFIKILEPTRGEDGQAKEEDGQSTASPFKSTVAYREFAYFDGELTIAIDASDWSDEETALIQKLAACVNSFGKRGSFWQYASFKTCKGPLPFGFTCPHDKINENATSHLAFLMTQALDDFGEELCKDKQGFQRVNTYAEKSIELGKHRVLKLTAVPYRRVAAGRHFTWYRREDNPI
ncbi:MAG TPA: hypothetical protein VKV18_01670 [Chthonomonas sp.]|uniref:hypothetical protein n=1 Tax=Chthonomonas sp. TaxID=2282153 RepID=UPI002B4B339D|nr:hypothetical protein [Chthonomonas sp.]HLI47385.1 hypothetical protein [Chthonomonas sp.]